ncbi:hypothetical protein JCM11491_001042 [Sporobolomyces phaffii]
MEMIAHRHDRAIHKLEQAVERGSSAACATLANLFSRGYCRAEQVNPTVSMSPPATGSAPSSVSPPVARPRLPNRSTSWNCHHEHQGHRSAESLKAAELYLKGLEIELDKPVEPPGRRGRKVTDESSSEEERAEGRYWTLQHALDLIVGLTDAHRFGVLQPPSTSESSNLNGSQPGKDPLDTSWNRSSRVSTRMLSHSTIAPVLATLSAESPISTLPIDPHSPTAAAPAPALARAMSTSSSSRRSQSVSRSYTHPAASIPDPGVHHQNQNRKLQVTIAIHALYILALQAFSSPSPVPVPDLPTPDASPVMSDETPIASSPTSVDSRASTAANLVRPGREAASEHGEKLSSTLFDIILRLAADPSNRVNGSIGIREGDELVSRARRRLDAIRNVERPGGDDWRFAKKKKNQSSVPAPIVDKKAGVRIPSQERLGPGHVKDRSDGTTSSSMTITPCSLNRRNLKFHFAEEEADDSETTRHAYPSPPDTPPATAEHLAANRQLAPLDTTTVAAGSSSPSLLTPKSLRSPPLASPLQPRYRSLHSQSSTQLARPRRDSLSSFRSTTPSALARFSDPSQRLLRRVESSTSVCTVPPDFGATRLKAGNKGKGKAFVDDPNDLGFGRRYGTGEMASGAARLGATTRGGDEDRKVGKSWLSRFFSVSGLNAVRESPNNDAKERLKEALKRDDEASSSVEYIMDWGDEDAPTEDEEEENICRAQLEDAATSPERRHSPVLEPVQASPPVIVPSEPTPSSPILLLLVELSLPAFGGEPRFVKSSNGGVESA